MAKKKAKPRGYFTTSLAVTQDTADEIRAEAELRGMKIYAFMDVVWSQSVMNSKVPLAKAK